VALIDIKCEAGHLISEQDFHGTEIKPDIEFLAIRTGFEKMRKIEAYWNSNPGLKASLANYLRVRFPSLRCIGFDFISITSWLHREEGKLAHKAFLCPDNKGRAILAVEDMSLVMVDRKIESLIVSPLFMGDGNGGAVTIMGKLL